MSDSKGLESNLNDNTQYVSADNINRNADDDDESYLINPEEEETDDISNEEFSNSKLFLNVEEKKVDEIIEEKEDPPRVQLDSENKNDNIQSIDVSDDINQNPDEEEELDDIGNSKLSLKNVEEREVDEITVEKEDLPMIQLVDPENENDLPSDLEEEEETVEEITEELENENDLSSALQEETVESKEDDALQPETAKEASEQMVSFTTLMEAKNDHSKEEDLVDIQLNPLMEEVESQPTDLLSVDIKETNSLPVESILDLTPEKPAAKIEDERQEWEQEKEKCLNASIEERKKKRKYTELSSVETWPQYYNKRLNIGHEKAEAENAVISNKVSIWKGDITSLLIDAIVNAANERLLGGGGVDGAIHAAAGPLLVEECFTFGGRSAGESVITAGYNLPARYIIHTVGPRGEKPGLLRECYTSSLELLIEENQRTIAFPCISTGIFGYPNDNAADLVLQTVREWLEKNHEKVDRVIFCLFLEKDIDFYEKRIQQYFPMMGGVNKSTADVTIEKTSFPAEEQGFPENVVRGNTSIPSESDQDLPSFDPIPPERVHSGHSSEHEEDETRSLLSTDSDFLSDHHSRKAQNGSRWKYWKSLFLCCFCLKPKTS